MFNIGDLVYYPEWGIYTDIEGIVKDISTDPSALGIEVTNYPRFRNHNLNGQISNFKGLYIDRAFATPLNKITPYSQFQTGDTEEDI